MARTEVDAQRLNDIVSCKDAYLRALQNASGQVATAATGTLAGNRPQGVSSQALTDVLETQALYLNALSTTYGLDRADVEKATSDSDVWFSAS